MVYGNIQFDGAGKYQIVSAVEGDTSSRFGDYSATGTYSISASGFGFLSNDLLQSPTFGSISNGIFIGSSTESGYNDLFVAAPVNGQNTGTLQGSYTLAYIHPAVPFDAVLQMSPQWRRHNRDRWTECLSGQFYPSYAIHHRRQVQRQQQRICRLPFRRLVVPEPDSRAAIPLFVAGRQLRLRRLARRTSTCSSACATDPKGRTSAGFTTTPAWTKMSRNWPPVRSASIATTDRSAPTTPSRLRTSGFSRIACRTATRSRIPTH